MISPVKTIRERLLITQEELGKRIGVCRQMIIAYEAGKSLPRFEIIKKLMDIARHNNIKIDSNDFFISKE